MPTVEEIMDQRAVKKRVHVPTPSTEEAYVELLKALNKKEGKKGRLPSVKPDMPAYEDTTQDVIDALLEAGRPLNRNEIGKAIGKTNTTVSDVMSRMEGLGISRSFIIKKGSRPTRYYRLLEDKL